MRQLDHFDFHSGVKISLADLKKMQERCLGALKKKKTRYSSSACGRALVVASKNSDGTIEMFVVSAGYERFVYEPVNQNKLCKTP